MYYYTYASGDVTTFKNFKNSEALIYINIKDTCTLNIQRKE